MRRQKTNWPPLRDMKPLEYCYLTWGSQIVRSSDNKKWEMYFHKERCWHSGEADSVSYWLRNSGTTEQFEEWKRRIAGIKRKELNRWVNKHGKHFPTASHTFTVH